VGADGRRGTREIRSTLPAGQVRLWHNDDAEATSVVVVEQNLVTPPAWVAVDLATGARTVLKRTEAPGVDRGCYVTERIFAPSGGVRVPVTIARRVDVEPGSEDVRGCLLYGYGAYESCEWPEYAVATLSLLDRGVVHAVAHVRGGGELGRRWWLDGRLRAKQHTGDDFVAARDALVSAGLAGPVGRVVSRGLSAGGLLQGMAFSQAPERWAGVIAEVPFVDVVTTMSDASIPLTVNEWDEWGNPAASAADFAAMLAYSPYDNPPAPPRPPLLVTGALHDPRVLVHEPAKWVARLRATDDVAHPAPLLLRVELGDGAHSGPAGRFALIRYEAEIAAWVLEQLGAGGTGASRPPAGLGRERVAE
jgi:oligopeptidase B